MQTFISIVIALLIFSVVVVIHEFGHFIVAIKNNVTVEEFSVGMGPRLLSRVSKKSGIRYSLKALPIGGSCAMLGEDEDNEEEGSFNSKSLGARMAIVFAGPFFNFILALLLSFIVIANVGTDEAFVVKIDNNSPAYKAGLRQGDKIIEYNGAYARLGREISIEEYVNPITEDGVSVKYIAKSDKKVHKINYTPAYENRYIMGMSYNGTSGPAEVSTVRKDSAFDKAGGMMGDIIISLNGEKITSGEDLVATLKENPLTGKQIELKVLRNSEERTLKFTPEMTKLYDRGFYYNGVRLKQNVGGIIKYSFVELRYEVVSVLKSLKLMVTGKVSADEISGPVGIVNMIGKSYKETKPMGMKVTILSLLNMTILLSANLGVMNLLPIPALDGGRLFLYLIELITRRKIPRDKEGFIHFIGFILLMGLMAFTLFNDIRKIF